MANLSFWDYEKTTKLIEELENGQHCTHIGYSNLIFKHTECEAIRMLLETTGRPKLLFIVYT